MFDDIYSRFTRKIPYKTLIFVPIIISVLMLAIVLVNGIPLGIDFRGGTLIEIETGDFDQVDALESDLLSIGLKDMKIARGEVFDTGKTILSISTTTVSSDALNSTLEKLREYFGVLRESDTVIVSLNERPSEVLAEKLSVRLGERIDYSYDRDAQELTISAFDLDEGELRAALDFYLTSDYSLDFQERNINIGEVKPSLGERLKQEGIKAAIFGYILMAAIIFLAFRDFIPSIAVLMAATCDALITMGFMSIFGILMEPASLVALLMLVGYSVDSDILLTTRLMKRRTRNVDEGIDSAIRTGLTMTGTTFVVMIVVYVVSTMLDVSALASIASVLVLGLIADVMTTWFMNAGMLKWYLEEKRGKFSIKSIFRG